MVRPRMPHALAPFALVAALLVGLPSAAAQAEAATGGAPGEATFFQQFDEAFARAVVGPLEAVIFFDLAFWDDPATGTRVPFIVAWLALGAVLFTLRFGFINVRGFRHAVACVRGAYDDPADPGEVTHFQALSSALSATVGLGNIAGVAVAVHGGGPGALFWMVVLAFFGMSSKFAECTLGMMYRETDTRGHIRGGPMLYLRTGLAELGAHRLGRALSVLFCVMCIGGSLGGGNMFQANQSYAQVAHVLPIFEGEQGALAYGLGLAALVGLVIIGGIRRIGAVASFIVPGMVALYMIAGLIILVTHAAHVGPALVTIVEMAFAPSALAGGLVGTMMMGFQRAAFSNESGVGSSPIAHSAAATDEPVREGLVALLEPFIDTIVVCLMTGLVIVVTGAYRGAEDGVVLTSTAFATVLPWFPKILSLTVFLFAYSTMISWSYYGERSWTYLFGDGSSILYKLLFLVFVVLGSVFELSNVLSFSDLMLLGMAFPNILGVLLLSGKVRAALDDYWSRLRSGVMRPDDPSARS